MFFRRKNKNTADKSVPDFNPILKYQKQIFIIFGILIIWGIYYKYYIDKVVIEKRPFLEELKKAEENFNILLSGTDTVYLDSIEP